MIVKNLKELFASQPNLDRLSLIILPKDDGLSLTVVPTARKAPASKQGVNPGPKFSSFVYHGSDEEMESVLAGNFIDQVSTDVALSNELVSSEEKKRKAIAEANKATEEAKKRKKEASTKDGDALKALREELAATKKELEEAKNPQTTLL